MSSLACLGVLKDIKGIHAPLTIPQAPVKIAVEDKIHGGYHQDDERQAKLQRLPQQLKDSGSVYCRLGWRD